MQYEQITPLILTYNEEANIARTLERLGWAQRIVVIDSHSTDATREILAGYPQVDVLERDFDDFASQCNYGLQHVDTEWVLSLDADYVLSNELVDEIRDLSLDSSVAGCTVPFVYCVFGKQLRGTLYPSRTVLYRKNCASYRQDGHAHRVEVDGGTKVLGSPIYHDDRKSLERWLEAQKRYVNAEVDKYRSTPSSDLSWIDRLRKRKLAPLLVPFYCLFAKGLLLDGKAGMYYTFQRTYAELLLALQLIDSELREDTD